MRRAPRPGAVLAHGVLVLLWLLLAGCGSGDARADPRPLCSSANDYFWYGQDVLGQGGSIPTGRRAERDIDGMRVALNDLAASVPPSLRDEVAFVQRMWDDTDRVLRRYDYGAGPRDVPEREYQQMMARYLPDRAKGVRLAGYLARRCQDQSEPFPTRPPEATG